MPHVLCLGPLFPSIMAESTGAPTGTRRGRGGLGKYLRAKGRRGTGRPAQFSERLLLEGEGPVDEDDEEEAERMQKFSRRQLGTNAERYVEPAPELDSDGITPQLTLSSRYPRRALQVNPLSSLKSICHRSSKGRGFQRQGHRPFSQRQSTKTISTIV